MGGYFEVGPLRLPKSQPVAVGLQPEVEKPFRLMFLSRYETDHILAQTRRNDVGVDVGGEAVFIFRTGGLPEGSLRILIDVFHADYFKSLLGVTALKDFILGALFPINTQN